MDIAETKKIINNYFANLYTNKLVNLKEILNTFLNTYNY